MTTSRHRRTDAERVVALSNLAVCSRAEAAEVAGVSARTIFRWQEKLRLGCLVAPEHVVETLLAVAGQEARNRHLVEILRLVVQAQSAALRRINHPMSRAVRPDERPASEINGLGPLGGLSEQEVQAAAARMIPLLGVRVEDGI